MGRYVRSKPVRLTEKLVQIRTALGLSQNGMLDRLGLADKLFRSSISSYELGASEPPLPILLQYARLAGVCLDVIVDDELDLPKALPGTPVHRGTKVAAGRRRRAQR
ncbi:MAG: helix-turn-helix transcriptional regulator [Pyrinomonadaceae bacterium]